MERLRKLFSLVKGQETARLEKDMPYPTFPKVKGVSTRPDQEIQIATTPRQLEIAGRAAANKQRLSAGPGAEVDPEEVTEKFFDTQGAVSYLPGKKKGPAIQHGYSNNVGPTVQHEATHYGLNQIHAQYGKKTHAAVINHLLSHFHPDDLAAIKTHLATRYPADDQHFNEETLTAARDYLQNPQARQALRSANLPGYDENRHKANYRRMLQSAKNLDDKSIRSLARKVR